MICLYIINILTAQKNEHSNSIMFITYIRINSNIFIIMF